MLLSREVMERIRKWPDDSANLKTVLGTMDCRVVEMTDDRVLVNINRPEEYANYFSPNPPHPHRGTGDREGSSKPVRYGIDLYCHPRHPENSDPWNPVPWLLCFPCPGMF